MNKGLVGIVILSFVAFLAALFVINARNSRHSESISFHEVIPANLTREIIQINHPYRVVEDLLNSNLIWKELEVNETDLVDFWSSNDSQFNELKTEALVLYYFQSNSLNYFLLEFENRLDSVSKLPKFNSLVLHNFVLFTKGEVKEFAKKYEEEAPLGEVYSFKNLLLPKPNQTEGIHLYQKKNESWNIHEITFLPEQIFSSSNVTKGNSFNEFTGKLDLSIFDYLPARFGLIDITQTDSLVSDYFKMKDSLSLSVQCGCDPQFSLTGWMEGPLINFIPMGDSSPIFLVKTNSLTNFINGMRDLKPDSLLFSEDNNTINYLGEHIMAKGFEMPFQFVLRIDDNVYFSNSKSQLEKLNFRIFSGLTVSSSEQVFTFIKNNISKGAYSISIRQGLSLGLLKSKKGLTLFQEKNQTEQLDYVSFIYSKEIEIGKGMVNPKWIQSFSESLANKIFKVKNHRTLDHNYLVQDKNDMLHFISPNGEVSWSKEVNGKILGDIKNIDLYGNQKYQLIFNTMNELYIVDILGRDVEDFPVGIKDTATANVSVMDYDKDLNFRFLVPTKAGIKSVNKQGELVSGWSQPLTKNTVLGDIEHILIQNLDYILVKDEFNKLYFFNRKGEERHQVSARFGTPFYLFEGSSIRATRAIFLDSIENTICRQFFDDKPVSILLSPQKRITQFFFVDWDKDGQKEFVLAFDDEIVIYGQDLIIKDRIILPTSYTKLKVWEEGVSYINEINELVIRLKEKNHLVEKAEAYELDVVKNRLRVLVKYGNDIKLLHLQ